MDRIFGFPIFKRSVLGGLHKKRFVEFDRSRKSSTYPPLVFNMLKSTSLNSKRKASQKELNRACDLHCKRSGKRYYYFEVGELWLRRYGQKAEGNFAGALYHA